MEAEGSGRDGARARGETGRRRGKSRGEGSGRYGAKARARGETGRRLGASQGQAWQGEGLDAGSSVRGDPRARVEAKRG
jgi:hypothetical protein